MFNRLRERASFVYNGGDVALPSMADSTSASTATNSINNTLAPNDEHQESDGDGDHHLQTTSSDTGTDKGTDAETDTGTDNSSAETLKGDHPRSTISHLDDPAQTVSSNNESDLQSPSFFSIFRRSQLAPNLPVPDATQTESNGLDEQTEQDAHPTLPSVGEEISIDKASNHTDSGFEDTHSQELPSLLSRMRLSATKAFFETSATTLAGSIHSMSASRHATNTIDDTTNSKASPSIDAEQNHIAVNTDNIDTSNHTAWDFSEEIAQDPEIRRLTEQIYHLRTEYHSVKESGKHSQRRRQEEYSKLKQYSNGKSRELWFATQKMRRFHGLGEYKTELKRCSLPAHDTSTPTLTMEAKLLRAQHQGAILERQLAIVHDFQQSMIDYLYTKALPDVKAEQELATLVGKSQLEKMIKARDTMVALFEDCLGLQRKIIAKYRLREIEHSRGMDGERLKQEVEHLKVMTGEIPAMERNPELRDSAKRRLEERLQVKDRQLERRKSREEDLIKATQKLIDDDQALVGKASEQIANISSHSIDLLLEINGNDDSDSDSANNHRTEPTNQSATKEPHDDMDSDSGSDISHCSLNDTGNAEVSNNLPALPSVTSDNDAKDQTQSTKLAVSNQGAKDTGNDEGSNDLVLPSVTSDDSANDQSQSTEPSNQWATEEQHGVLKSDSGFDINQSNDTGNGEEKYDLVRILVSNDITTAEEVHKQQEQSKADSKEIGEIDTTMNVPSEGADQPKDSHDDASASQGSSRSTANRSMGTTGMHPPPGVARVRALRAARDLNSSERSFGSTSNHGDGDQGISEHSNSESGDDHLEPISPRSTTRKSQSGVSASQRYAARASTTGIRSRNELLERARLARLSNQGATTGPAQGSTLESAATLGTGNVRPALGMKAMSSRDFASRRSLAVTNPSSRTGLGLGGSEHRSSLIVPPSLSSSERSERARASISIAAERQARMERIASRRQSSIEVSAIQQARSDDKPTISAERRAQIRAGLANRGVGTKLDNGGEGRKE